MSRYKIAINHWGPAAWNFLHAVTLTLPDQPSVTVQEAYGKFFNSVADVLPCNVCRGHFRDNLKKFPMDFSSKRKASMWLWQLHNSVNASNNKPPIDYYQFLAQYIPPEMYMKLELTPEEIEKMKHWDQEYQEKEEDEDDCEEETYKILFWVFFSLFVVTVIIWIIVCMSKKKQAQATQAVEMVEFP